MCIAEGLLHTSGLGRIWDPGISLAGHQEAGRDAERKPSLEVLVIIASPTFRTCTPVSTGSSVTPSGSSPAANTGSSVTPSGSSPAANTGSSVTPSGSSPAANTGSSVTPSGSSPAANTGSSVTPSGSSPAANTGSSVTPSGSSPAANTGSSVTPSGSSPAANTGSSVTPSGSSPAANTGSSTTMGGSGMPSPSGMHTTSNRISTSAATSTSKGRPSGPLKPWEIFLIALVSAVVVVGFFAGLFFCVKNSLSLRDVFDSAVHRSHGPHLGPGPGGSHGAHWRPRWSPRCFWRRPVSSAAMEMTGQYHRP
ncbi:PREDICTED: mucin-21 [Miniopterus natalensis]|uniref:mucin-21 n=1 Tax=Miniopterus natalensis TaxID=291302 RepID=UPI0007A724AF|nr:PREDICTED: mucin-21 [Miniopterus natalensis]